MTSQPDTVLQMFEMFSTVENNDINNTTQTCSCMLNTWGLQRKTFIAGKVNIILKAERMSCFNDCWVYHCSCQMLVRCVVLWKTLTIVLSSPHVASGICVRARLAEGFMTAFTVSPVTQHSCIGLGPVLANKGPYNEQTIL